jgi:hypothetical protein
VQVTIDHAVADLKFKDAVYGPITDRRENSAQKYVSTIFTASATVSIQIKLSSKRDVSSR